MKLKDIGIGKDVEVAQPPRCEKDGTPAILMGSNFKTREEVIGFTLNTCDEWDCPHTFAFIKFNDGECAVAVHEPLHEEDEEYDWNVYKIKWKNVGTIKQYNLESNTIHFATVIEQNKYGDFIIITD